MKNKIKLFGFIAIVAVIGFSALSLIGCEAVEDTPTVLNNATVLTQDVWADGNVPAETDEQWFTFNATAATQYILYETGTMFLGKLQLYGSDAVTKIGEEKILLGAGSFSQALPNGSMCYIKVTGFQQTTTTFTEGTFGTYKIAFSTENAPPAITLPTENVTQLTVNTWYNGNFSSALSEQWFKFTATADTQFIQWEKGSITMVNVRLYDNTGKTVGDSATLYDSNTNTSQAVTNGSLYYVRVTAIYYSGTYKIGITASTTPPPITLPTENVTQLTANTFSNGSITSGGQQWFKFTATNATQYIHFKPGTTMDDAYIQLYDNTGTAVGDKTRLNSNTTYTSQTVTNANDYYIKVTPYSSSKNGAYQITFSDSFALGDVIQLAEKVWAEGSLADLDSAQWVKFTATANPQYIYAKSGTLTPRIQLYDATGSTVGDSTTFNSSNPSASRTVTIGNVYYIKVDSFGGIQSEDPHSYQITFSSLSTAPIPTASAIQLTKDVWAGGSIASSGGEQWFKFTATAGTHYLYFSKVTAYTVYVQLYDPDGATIGNNINLTVSSNSTPPTALTVTSGSTYYVKVILYMGSNPYTYQIGYNDSATTPPPITLPTENVTSLTADTLSNGNIASRDNEQWFKFTATADTQYFLFKTITSSDLTSVGVQLYDSNGRTVGDKTYLYIYNTPLPVTVTNGSVYHIKVTTSYFTGTYQIGFSKDFPPTRTTSPVTATNLTANTWGTGAIDNTTGEQWFKFTATADTQYIHFKAGTGTGGLTVVYLQLYNETGTAIVGEYVSLYSTSSSPKTYQDVTLTNGSTYYIKATRYSGTNTAYQLGFTTSTTAPAP